MGHSLGGYIAGHFLKIYPKLVTSLILLSPAGVNYPPENSKEYLENVIENQNFILKILAKNMTHKIFVEKVKIQITNHLIY